MKDIEILKIERENRLWGELIRLAETCSWIAGKHLVTLMKSNAFTEWESVFAAVRKDEIVGFCTFMKTDYYPDNKYFPWISTIFVSEEYRGRGICGKLIQGAVRYAKTIGFSKVYIPSDMTGFYERYGFVKIDELVNYGGDVDNVFVMKI